MTKTEKRYNCLKSLIKLAGGFICIKGSTYEKRKFKEFVEEDIAELESSFIDGSIEIETYGSLLSLYSSVEETINHHFSIL